MGKRGNDLSVARCVKYNIGSFLAVLLLGSWYFSASLIHFCPNHTEPASAPLSFEPGRGVNAALKTWSAKKRVETDVRNSGKAGGKEDDSVASEESAQVSPKQQEDTEEITPPSESKPVDEAVPAEAPPSEPEEEAAPTPEPTASEEVASGDSQSQEGEPHWIFCSAQWQECSCGGNVRWGNDDKWKIIKPKKAGQLQEVKCNVQVLEDLIPGDDGKHCECLVSPGNSFYKKLNPMLQSESDAEASGAKLVASCEIFEAGKDQGDWGRAQWEAVEAFCSKSWEKRAVKDNPSLEAGARKLKLTDMQKLMRARIDPRFVSTYDKLFGGGGSSEKKGWIPRAFVNYFAGSPAGKHAKMTEELIRSAHAFSSEPIIVVHFGMTTSPSLTPENYPRLVLLHAAPFSHLARKSFNFNKLRAFLFARALTGVELDSDQFLAPQVDRVFAMTETEITKEYPMPIMPVHFLDRGPKDLGAWWDRYCPDTVCSLQTLRWGHAHPTWTYWALPFIGRWLRKHMRDETLLAVDVKPKGGGRLLRAPALRVADIPEDEDLLNVALWEEKATKQWCKFDITDPLEFRSLLEWKPSHGNRCSTGSGCSNIFDDRRFYRHGGAAKMFYTAHHAVVPSETAKYVSQIQKKVDQGTWPDAVVFDGKFWPSGETLRKAHPKMECLV
eukprot:TRINITY_DN32666_c0_g1_i1.p1 TRINITY_DN32666_c0_g1~~TRINITY_DN32666_c0_g1_i1.p1  ORF type:complete len:668 (+),score=122.01 TRINITY_DN32666_c0_g1_i1:106-2109(+)